MAIFCKLAAVLGVILIVCIPAQAEEVGQQDSQRLQDMVVTATRFEREYEKIPAKVTVIDREDIEKSGADSVPEVLRGQAGIQVKDLSGNSMNQTIDMGGFGEGSEHRVAVLVNGRRMNPVDLNNVSWSTISLDRVERIEVLHGGNAVLYGDNAMGGVINIITKRPEEGVQGQAEVRGGSFSTLRQQAEVNMSQENVGVSLGASQLDTDGYRDRSAADTFGIFGRLDLDLSQDTQASLEVSKDRAYYELPGSLTREEKKDDRRQAGNENDDGRDEDFALNLGLEHDLSPDQLLDLQASYRKQERESNMDSWSSYLDYDIDTWGLSPKYILENSLGDLGNRLTLGADIYYTDYSRKDDSIDWTTFQPVSTKYDHSKITYSGYAQNELEIVDDLFLSLGARYQDTEFRLRSYFEGDKTSYTVGEPEWAWNVGFAYSFKRNSKVYARAYQAFRYPLVDEYMVDPNYALDPADPVNKELEHEKQRGYETGIRLALQNSLIFDLQGFYFIVDDEIIWSVKDPATRAGQNENLRETEHLGANLNLNYQLREYINLFGSAAYTQAEITAGEYKNNNIPLVPKWKVNAGLELGRFEGVLMRLQYNYVGKRYYGDDFENDQERMDSYNTVDAFLSYMYNDLEFFAHAKNIFGEEYSDYANYYGDFYYYPQPKQEYLVGVRCRF